MLRCCFLRLLSLSPHALFNLSKRVCGLFRLRDDFLASIDNLPYSIAFLAIALHLFRVALLGGLISCRTKSLVFLFQVTDGGLVGIDHAVYLDKALLYGVQR